MINFEQWEGFEGRIWKEEVNVRDFIQKNYTPYNGDESFLAGPHTALILVLLTTVIPPLQEADANYRRKYHQYGCG